MCVCVCVCVCVKSPEFGSQVEASPVSSHTEV